AMSGERDANGPYESPYDFIERVPSGTINRRTLENLVLAGAFDSYSDFKREDFVEVNAKGETFSEQLVRYGQAFHNDKMSSEMSLFGDDAELSTAGRPPMTPAQEWPMTQKLEKERELVGRYLSAHPLDPYYMELTYGLGCPIKDFVERGPIEGAEVRLGGMVIDFQTRQGKNGPFGIMKIEDYTGSTEFMLFGQSYYDFRNYGEVGTPVLLTGVYQRRFASSPVKFEITNMQLLNDVKGKLIRNITINVDVRNMNKLLKSIIEEKIHGEGEPQGELSFRVFDPSINRALHLSSGKRIHITRELVQALDSLNAEILSDEVSDGREKEPVAKGVTYTIND
ncbi:MAG: hypothetical protein K2J94_08920, partial [Duncaniella sp.]|nr:hypothetical protein [Duncaniella sp.]